MSALPCNDCFSFTTDTFGEVTFESGGITYLLQFDLFTNDPNIVIIGNTVWTGEGDINDLWVIMRLTEIAGPAARAACSSSAPASSAPRRSESCGVGGPFGSNAESGSALLGGRPSGRPPFAFAARARITRHCGWSSRDGAL